MTLALPDPVDLTAALVRCPSITPVDAGALDVVAAALMPFGFSATRIDRGGVCNLYLRRGTDGPVFGFNGHTDVVPEGDAAAWTHPPFSAEIADGELWGRGAVDMKSAVAAFAAAAAGFVTETPPQGSVALLITGDEEGAAEHGTRAILDWMAAEGERLDVCLVGEPTSAEAFGDAIKIGRRGSLTARFVARGRQGHTAYPARALNPLPALARLMDRLASTPLDAGTAHFEPSTLAITTIDTGNPATNVIPAEARATANIRFNAAHDGASLTARLRAAAEAVTAETGVGVTVETHLSAECFVTPPGPFVDVVSAAVEAETGARPSLSTAGGTSDARFLKDHCPVVELGLVGRGMHAVDERAPVEDIRRLARLYRGVLARWFATV